MLLQRLLGKPRRIKLWGGPKARIPGLRLIMYNVSDPIDTRITSPIYSRQYIAPIFKGSNPVSSVGSMTHFVDTIFLPSPSLIEYINSSLYTY